MFNSKFFQKLLLLVLSVLISHFAYGQLLWPGDVNNNGIVNGIDVLYAGIAIGSEGEERPSATENWQAQPLGSLWENNFFDGLNYAYADCDGNGEVEDDDIKETIKNNFFLSHGTIIPDEFSTNGNGNAPFVRLLPQNSSAGLNEIIVIDLWVGDENMPVQNFYGIAISLKYNDDITFLGEWEFEEVDNPWFDPTSDDSEEIFVVDEANAKMEIVITRTNQLSISGAGKVGEFSIVIEDIILGLQYDTLNLEIESIRMIDKDFNTLPIVKDSTFVIVSRPNATTTHIEDAPIHVFPNPTTDYISVISDVEMLAYELRDLTGKLILNIDRKESPIKATIISLSTYGLKSQVYLLKVLTKDGVFIRKIILD